MIPAAASDIALRFRCAELNCARHYADGHGYFNVVDGHPVDEKFQQLCPGCSTPMYLSEVEETVEIWCCPQCAQEQQLLG